MATLIARYGPAAGLPGVLAALSADRPRRITGQQYDLCGSHFPNLGGT